MPSFFPHAPNQLALIMILAFGKHAPSDSFHHAKKFGLLSLVVSVAVALGLAALGPDTDGASWFALVVRQGSGAASLDSNGTTQDYRDLSSTEVGLSSEALLGSTQHGLRHLGNGGTGWNADSCTCTGNANTGGFDYIELHFSGDDLTSNIGSFIEKLEVISSKQGGTTIYDEDDTGNPTAQATYGTDAIWTPDEYSHHVLKFGFPPEDKAKKITETSFHICFASRSSQGDCNLSSSDTQCYYLGDGCYEWKLHTSCSVLPLIGEQLSFDGSSIVVEVVEWADRQGHVCRPCGNGVWNGGEECENLGCQDLPDGCPGPIPFPGEDLGSLPDGCTTECVCNDAEGYKPVLDDQGELTGQCSKSICGDGERDEDEECDGGEFCKEDCTCKDGLYYDASVDDDAPTKCVPSTCFSPNDVTCEETTGLTCKCGTCGGPVCNEGESCCDGNCVNAGEYVHDFIAMPFALLRTSITLSNLSFFI